jgi:hypothetical protein
MGTTLKATDRGRVQIVITLPSATDTEALAVKGKCLDAVRTIEGAQVVMQTSTAIRAETTP